MEAELKRIIRIANCTWMRIITCLLSVLEVPRLSGKSKLKILPKDLIREMAGLIRDIT